MNLLKKIGFRPKKQELIDALNYEKQSMEQTEIQNQLLISNILLVIFNKKLFKSSTDIQNILYEFICQFSFKDIYYGFYNYNVEVISSYEENEEGLQNFIRKGVQLFQNIMIKILKMDKLTANGFIIIMFGQFIFDKHNEYSYQLISTIDNLIKIILQNIQITKDDFPKCVNMFLKYTEKHFDIKIDNLIKNLIHYDLSKVISLKDLTLTIENKEYNCFDTLLNSKNILEVSKFQQQNTFLKLFVKYNVPIEVILKDRFQNIFEKNKLCDAECLTNMAKQYYDAKCPNDFLKQHNATSSTDNGGIQSNIQKLSEKQIRYINWNYVSDFLFKDDIKMFMGIVASILIIKKQSLENRRYLSDGEKKSQKELMCVIFKLFTAERYEVYKGLPKNLRNYYDNLVFQTLIQNEKIPLKNIVSEYSATLLKKQQTVLEVLKSDRSNEEKIKYLKTFMDKTKYTNIVEILLTADKVGVKLFSQVLETLGDINVVKFSSFLAQLNKLQTDNRNNIIVNYLAR